MTEKKTDIKFEIETLKWQLNLADVSVKLEKASMLEEAGSKNILEVSTRLGLETEKVSECEGMIRMARHILGLLEGQSGDPQIGFLIDRGRQKFNKARAFIESNPILGERGLEIKE